MKTLSRWLAVVLIWAAAAPIGRTDGPYDRRNAIVEAIEKAQDAIVNIRTLRVIPARLENSEGGRVRGLGTGVIIDPRGYVVTNYHVVEKVDEVQVLTANRREFPAKIVSFDSRMDLAVLRIESGANFKYLPLCGAGQPMRGETVIAIGNPYGLENSVSTGIVSALDRELKLPNGEIFRGLIQTDASINPGNSGGPLLTINGDLLGINVAIRSNAQGIGFAIPTPMVLSIVDRIMGGAGMLYAKHGLILDGLSEDYEVTRRKQAPTVRVRQVEPGSPAQKIGFQPGDELVAVAGQSVRMRFDLDRIFWDRKFGDSVSFTVRRSNGEIKEMSLVIQPPKELSDAEAVWQYFGVQTNPVPAEQVRGVNAKLNGGLLLLKVQPSSAAAEAGLQPGDILIGLHEWEMINDNNIRYVMQWKELESHQPIKYVVIREGAVVSGQVRMPALRTP